MSRASVESLRFYLEHLKQKYIEPFERELAIVESVAKGAQQAVSYLDYASMISSVSVLAKDHYKIGQNVMIVTLNVPDLWVSGILEEFTPFVYVSDEQFVLELNTNGYVDVGYHRLSALETGKINLPDYVKKEDRDEFVKGGVVENSLPLTDEEKTAGCDWLGALSKPSTTGILSYDKNKNIVSTRPAYQSVPGGGQIPVAKVTGCITTNDPIDNLDCVNKQYAEDNFVAQYTPAQYANPRTYAYTVYRAGGATGEITQRPLLVEASATADSIARRGGNGVLYVGTPTVGGHAVNMQYFNDNRIYCHRIIWVEPNFFDGADVAMYFNIFARGISKAIADETYTAEIKALFVAGRHIDFDTAVIATTDNSLLPIVKIYYDENSNEIVVCRMSGQDINQIDVIAMNSLHDTVV